MTKIVINKRYGGFSLSHEAIIEYNSRSGTPLSQYHRYDTKRDDPILVAIVEEWGSERVSGAYAKLAVVEVPDDANWEITEYDGMEHVAERHRTWS